MIYSPLTYSLSTVDGGGGCVVFRVTQPTNSFDYIQPPTVIVLLIKSKLTEISFAEFAFVFAQQDCLLKHPLGLVCTYYLDIRSCIWILIVPGHRHQRHAPTIHLTLMTNDVGTPRNPSSYLRYRAKKTISTLHW